MTIIYHNPRCSKSREALKILEDNNIQATIRLYLQDTPSKDELLELLSQLKLTPIELMRTKETLYKELKLNKESSDEAQLQAMLDHPKLIERPIVIYNNNAKIGRPPESILELFK